MNTKLLLIGGGNPLATGVGEQFISGMLDGFPRRNLVRFSLSHTLCEPLVDWQGSAAHVRRVDFSALPIRSSFNDWKFRARELDKHAKEISGLVDAQTINVAWVTLNFTSIIHLAHRLRNTLSIPYVVTVWDSPEYLIHNTRLDRVSGKRILKRFAEVLQSAAGVVTISPQMTDIYRKTYGIESVPMVFCPPAETWQPANHRTVSKRPITVAFAGSLYAWREWNAFLDAMEIQNNDPAKPNVKVICIGNQSRWARRRKWVEYVPLKPSHEAAAIVNQADIAYLPYWMDQTHSHFVKTAFPSKLPFYIASGTPVFFHGPAESTPSAFLKKNPVGISCHSLDPAEILKSFELATANQTFVDQFESNRQQVLNGVFHPNRCVEIFAEIVDKCTQKRRSK